MLKMSPIILFILLIVSCNNSHPAKEKYYEHFIAHAGGEIDGIIYTNSLEALNLSYSKGCKYFELDLCYTADNKLVAIHDPTGLTEEEFLSQTISGKYTPLNVEAINLWFLSHPDAILVTDKINDPQRVFDEFNFHDRIIMELFSWEAIDKAIEIGITPLVSEKLFFASKDIESVLLNKKITYVNMGMLELEHNKSLLKRLKKKGIKNYIFHLETKPELKPVENYVWKNEMQYCYGMYANSLDLLDSLMHN